ncbi:MAG: hypothetical protein AAF541_00345 [Pseudomonadota bacterium]
MTHNHQSSEDTELDDRLRDHFARTQIPAGLAGRVEAAIDQLDSPSHMWVPNWLSQGWWRPVTACMLPLVIGFITGQSITTDSVSEDIDIAGIVYLDGFEADWELNGITQDDFPNE